VPLFGFAPLEEHPEHGSEKLSKATTSHKCAIYITMVHIIGVLLRLT
jgi:hypothetical protein